MKRPFLKIGAFTVATVATAVATTMLSNKSVKKLVKSILSDGQSKIHKSSEENNNSIYQNNSDIRKSDKHFKEEILQNVYRDDVTDTINSKDTKDTKESQPVENNQQYNTDEYSSPFISSSDVDDEVHSNTNVNFNSENEVNVTDKSLNNQESPIQSMDEQETIDYQLQPNSVSFESEVQTDNFNGESTLEMPQQPQMPVAPSLPTEPDIPSSPNMPATPNFEPNQEIPIIPQTPAQPTIPPEQTQTKLY